MTTRDQQKHGPRAAHAWRVAHLACGLLLAACNGADPSIDAFVDPNDVDGDGIPNAADLCPESYDPEQHDEDADGVGDPCDVCPSIPDADQEDLGEQALQFGDGVGDACDPRPSRDGDKLARFDAFAVDSSERWAGEGFTIERDVATTTGDARLRSPMPLQVDGLYARIHVASLTWTSAAGRIDVAVDGDGVASGFSCGVVPDTDADGDDEIELVQHGGANQVVRATLGVPVTLDLQITAWRTIDSARDGHIFCFVRHGTGAEHELRIELPTPIPRGFYAFGSSGATADVASIAVYTFPISPCAFVAGHDCPDP
jgi:hypothetical protein